MFEVTMETDTLTLEVVMPDSPEHELLWKQLAEHRINKGLPQPTIAENEFGLAWMYMYTTQEHFRFLWFTWNRYVHIFRHRMHPKTGGDVHLSIPVRKGFDLGSLVTTWSVKKSKAK